MEDEYDQFDDISKTGYDDAYLYTIHRSKWDKNVASKWFKTLFIACIPFSGVGSIQPHVMIPIVFYLYLRNFTIIAFLILLWIIVEFFVYSLFGVWDFGAYFNFDYKAIWLKKLRGEEYYKEEEEEEEEEESEEKSEREKRRERRRRRRKAKYTDEEQPERREEERRSKRYGLSVSVMNKLKKRGLEDRTEQIALFIDDVGYERDPEDPDPVGVVIQNLLVNVIIDLVSVLFAGYAVRAYSLEPFGRADHFTWQLAIQMVMIYIPLSLQGAITAWYATLFSLVLIWGVFAPWNTEGYRNFTTRVASPYIFWSVITLYFTIVFSRMYTRCGNTKVYPWPTDKRYYVNAYFGLAFAFFITSLIYTIVDA